MEVDLAESTQKRVEPFAGQGWSLEDLIIFLNTSDWPFQEFKNVSGTVKVQRKGEGNGGNRGLAEQKPFCLRNPRSMWRRAVAVLPMDQVLANRDALALE